MATRVVVTGASGNVGTAVLRALAGAAEGYDVVGVVRRPPTASGPYRGVTWHPVDVGAPGADLRLAPICSGADCVIHLAWAVRPARDVDHLYRVDVGGTTALLEAAHRAGVGHFVHLSSAAAYAAGRYGQRVDESWPTAGIDASVYSRTKAAAERLLDDFERTHRGATVIARLRPGLIVGGDAAALRLLELPARAAPRPHGRRPRRAPDGTFAVPFVHVDDVASAVLAVVRGRHRGAFNLAADTPLRTDDLAVLLGARPVHVASRFLRRAARGLGLQPVDRGSYDLAVSMPLLDTTRARGQLNWTPRRDSRVAPATEVDRGAAQPPPAEITYPRGSGGTGSLNVGFGDARSAR